MYGYKFIPMLHPDFIKRTKELLHDEYDAFEEALDSQPTVSIRINPRKMLQGQNGIPEAPLPRHTEQHHHSVDKVPWCETGYYLPERPSFTFDPLFHAGTYYVQEASSMFLEQALKRILEEPEFSLKQRTVLDLCAAPGGKSTHIRALLPENSLLVCNEVIRSRSMILAENMAKWGSPGNIITHNDPKEFGRLTHLFDIIVADLPCSGEGMFRKDTASRNEWSVDNVKLCASRQKRIIHDVWDTLKPGGWLIYSTCTFNTEENEDNVYTLAKELGAEIMPVPAKEEWNITGALKYDIPVYRFFPHRTQGEGFFLALMRKNGKATDADTIKAKQKNNKQQITIPAQIKQALLKPDRFIFRTSQDTTGKDPKTFGKQTGTVYATPAAHENQYAILSGHLNIIAAGILLGEFKGKDFLPSVSLALSTEINSGVFPIVELPYDQAIAYLQREAVIMPGDAPKGYILVTYKGTPLGFVKNIGNRANNLYPQEWRIRSRKHP